MPKDEIFVTRPHLPPLAELVPYLEKIWDRRILTNGGPFHQELEARLCDYLGVPHISLFNNGTIALITALQALEVSGEVITTPYSFVATSNALLWNGIRPVFSDIDPITLNLDPERIESAITEHTSAILPVHCYGRPCAVEAMEKIAQKHNLKLVYDAAHAFGVRNGDRGILNYGDLSILSFHATKVFNTFEGGAIVSHTPEMKRVIDNLKNFGFVNETTVVQAGINGKMSEINCAVGLLQLEHLESAIAQRQSIARYYNHHLSLIPGITIVGGNLLESSNHSYYPILVEQEYPISRDELYEYLKSKGIFSRRYFYPLISDLKMFQGIPSGAASNIPVAKKIADKVLCLPIYPDLDQDSLERIVSEIAAPGSSSQVQRR
ncbi:DegT/DnrJ/EryC1/StrS family aminotransferase [Herbaspirillum huttiense]|uniref:DegT/DnrJ/EryC1/StrS family aminotransferase n=1 Tax=Herbaspirillum huttiense TaxID=863372 RepID=UPI0039B00386